MLVSTSSFSQSSSYQNLEFQPDKKIVKEFINWDYDFFKSHFGKPDTIIDGRLKTGKLAYTYWKISYYDLKVEVKYLGEPYCEFEETELQKITIDGNSSISFNGNDLSKMDTTLVFNSFGLSHLDPKAVDPFNFTYSYRKGRSTIYIEFHFRSATKLDRIEIYRM